MPKKIFAENNIIGKNNFIRELAKESGMSQVKARKFWNATETVISRILEEGLELNLGRFGKFYVTEYVSRSNVAGGKKQNEYFPKRRISFKASGIMKHFKEK